MTFSTDQWRARYINENGSIQFSQVIDLLARLDGAGLDIIKTEQLYTFDGQQGFSLGQGE